MATQKATTTLPFLYRFLLLNIDSVFAFGGVLMILLDPGSYIFNITRESVTTIQPATDFIYTELAGGWLYIAFSEAVVLRFVDDLRVWRYVCAGILLSDALYTHSLAQAVGGWSEYVKIANWTVMDWVATITTWPFVLTRLAIVLGIGYQVDGDKRE